MSSHSSQNADSWEETIELLVRKVLAQLDPEASSRDSDRETTTETPVNFIPGSVISVSSLDRLNDAVKQITVSTSAIVTPAARDELRARGVEWSRVNAASERSQGRSANGEPMAVLVGDDSDGKLASALVEQLQRRGVEAAMASAKTIHHLDLHQTALLLSDLPARDVEHLCRRHDLSAVSVEAIATAERIAGSMQPRVWVLDRVQMNLTTLVRVAQICLQPSALGRSAPGGKPR